VRACEPDVEAWIERDGVRMGPVRSGL